MFVGHGRDVHRRENRVNEIHGPHRRPVDVSGAAVSSEAAERRARGKGTLKKSTPDQAAKVFEDEPLRLPLGCIPGRTWVIDNHVQIVGQEIRTLEAVTKRKILFEVVGRPIGLASGRGAFRFARPVEIGLNIVERADLDVRNRDHGLPAPKPQLLVEQLSHWATRTVKAGRSMDAGRCAFCAGFCIHGVQFLRRLGDQYLYGEADSHEPQRLRAGIQLDELVRGRTPRDGQGRSSGTRRRS